MARENTSKWWQADWLDVCVGYELPLAAFLPDGKQGLAPRIVPVLPTDRDEHSGQRQGEQPRDFSDKNSYIATI